MRRLFLATLLAVGLAPATALAIPDGGIELVSRPTGFGPLPFDGASYATVGAHALSADGCKVVFQSDNDVLSPLDDDVNQDIYRVDRCAPGQPVVLVSATATGVPGDGESFTPSISADGNRVAFATEARNLLPAGATALYSIVVKDIASGEVILAGQDHGAHGQVADSYTGVISGDGNAVAFQARGPVDAENAKGSASADDVYVRFLAGAQTVMVSASGNASGGADDGFDISDDGTRVAFASRSAFVAGDVDDAYDAYLADVSPAGMVSRRLASAQQSPEQVAISGDGQTVAFGDDRVWVANCSTDPCGSAAQVDGAPANTGQRIYGLGFPTAPAAAGLVTWSTDRALLPEDTNGTYDLYASSLPPTPHVVLPFGTTPNGTGGGAITGDLALAVSESSSLDLPGTDGVHVQVFARSGGETTLLSQPAGVPARRDEASHSEIEPGAVSENGRFVAMETTSPALGAPLLPGNGRWTREIVVRDVAAGVTAVVSSGSDGAPADRGSESPKIDAAGARVAFASNATNLAPGATDGTEHVYVRDLATATAQLVDRKSDGAPASGGADGPDISQDGTKVAFLSRSPDLPGAGNTYHAYVADLATGAISLVDQTTTGQPANSRAEEVVLDADGSRAAFISAATNLGADGDGSKVFLKDLTSGAVTYVSVPESGTPAQNARNVSIDAAGDRVAWTEAGATFGYGADGRSHVFVRDLPAGVTTLASTGGVGHQESAGELDASGARLAFISGTDARPYVYRPFLRDLTAGNTVPLLPARTGDGFDVSISPDGICAAITSNSPDVIEGNPSPDFDQVYLRAAGGTCAPRAAGGQPGGGPASGGAVDTTPPVISGLRMTHRRFAVRRRATAFVFALSEDSRTSIALARCVKQHKRRCARYRVVAMLTRAHTKRGRNRIAFGGRIGKRELAPGRYRATAGAVDAAGNRALPRRVRFKIVRR